MITQKVSRNVSKAVLAVAIVGLFVVSCSGSSGTVVGPVEAKPSVTVSGLGEATGEPDMATIQLGISIQDGDLGQAVNQSNLVMSRIKDALVEEGVEEADMQTSNFSVWPETRYERETGEPTGEVIYHVDSALQIKVRELSSLGAVIQAGLDAGANNVSGISFGIDDAAELEAQARAAALADARDRAEQLAEGLGAKLGDPFSVSESISGNGPIPFVRMEVAEAAASEVPISAGQLSVSVQVQVTFELKP